MAFSPRRRVWRLASATLLFGLGLASPALAHAHLKSETPVQNSSGPAPKDLRLKFSEALEVRFTTVKVTGPSKEAIATGALALDPADATMLIVPLPASLAPGQYTVAWFATATDTHKTKGSYSFTVQP